MTIIHKNERTRVRIGKALYLNPSYSGQGLYLNQKKNLKEGGFFGNILPLLSSGANFVKNNSSLIKDGIEAGAKVASAINDIKRASEEAKENAEKIKEIRKIRETINDKRSLTEEQKRLIDKALASASVKSGSGLKRF